MVITTSSSQRSSRPATWGQRPWDVPRQKLSKALESRVLFVLDRPGPARRAEPGAGEADEAVEVALPEVLGGGVAAGLEVAYRVRDGAVVLGRHGTPLRCRGARPRATSFYPALGRLGE